jgi:hypothetical protein
VRKLLKLCLGIGAIFLALSHVGESRAAITLADWALNPQTTPPATWTYKSSSLASTTPVTFSQAAGSNILDVDFISAPLAAGTYTLNYNISLSPNTVFTGAEVSATLSGDPQSAVVTMTGQSLNLSTLGTNGGSNDTTSIAGLTSIDVAETIHVTQGEVVSIADSFNTASAGVPEPSSLLVWGLLLGTCWIRRSACRQR